MSHIFELLKLKNSSIIFQLYDEHTYKLCGAASASQVMYDTKKAIQVQQNFYLKNQRAKL